MTEGKNCARIKISSKEEAKDAIKRNFKIITGMLNRLLIELESDDQEVSNACLCYCVMFLSSWDKLKDEMNKMPEFCAVEEVGESHGTH